MLPPPQARTRVHGTGRGAGAWGVLARAQLALGVLAGSEGLAQREGRAPRVTPSGVAAGPPRARKRPRAISGVRTTVKVCSGTLWQKLGSLHLDAFSKCGLQTANV